MGIINLLKQIRTYDKKAEQIVLKTCEPLPMSWVQTETIILQCIGRGHLSLEDRRFLLEDAPIIMDELAKIKGCHLDELRNRANANIRPDELIRAMHRIVRMFQGF